jgi:energy-coupling factor transport system permease protein
MNAEMLSYIRKDSPIHRLSGATKLICFLLWTVAAMVTYDTRVLLGMLIFGLVVFRISKIEYKIKCSHRHTDKCERGAQYCQN